MHGGHDRHVASLRCQRLHQGTEYGFLFQQVVAVQGEQEVVSLAQSGGWRTIAAASGGGGCSGWCR